MDRKLQILLSYKLNILYYSTSYHAKHGGSIQSISFFEHLGRFSKSKSLFIQIEIHNFIFIAKHS